MLTHDMQETGILEQYTGSLRQHIEEEYRIEDIYLRSDLKRGLRNADGTGVPVGVTKVGSVMGYMIEDGIRVRNEGDRLVVDIHIEVVFGMNISAIAKSIVNKVRYTVEEATGLTVKKVNVFVDGIQPE